MRFGINRFLQYIMRNRIMSANSFAKSNQVKSVYLQQRVEPHPEQATELFNGTGNHGRSRARYSSQNGLSHDYWGF